MKRPRRDTRAVSWALITIHHGHNWCWLNSIGRVCPRTLALASLLKRRSDGRKNTIKVVPGLPDTSLRGRSNDFPQIVVTIAAPVAWGFAAPSHNAASDDSARLCPACKKRLDAETVHCPADGAETIINRQGSTVAGRYVVGRLISLGSDGAEIWGAQQQPVDRRIALKILPPGDEAATQRFERGAHIAASLNHPHINTVHDFGTTEDGALFLVSEFLRGATLSRFLRDMPLDRERAILAVEQLLDALEHCHGNGYIHRDIKPENVCVTSLNDDSFVVQLLDFSIARHVDDDAGEGKKLKNLKRRLTLRQQFCGTPAYMSPEQVVGTALDGRTDIHALGVMLFRMLTGVLPFTGEDRYEVFQQRVSNAPPTLAAACPERAFSPELEAFVATAMAKHAVDRFRTTQVMRAALEEVKRAPSPPQPRGKRTTFARNSGRLRVASAPAPVEEMATEQVVAEQSVADIAAIPKLPSSPATSGLTSRVGGPPDTIRDARPSASLEEAPTTTATPGVAAVASSAVPLPEAAAKPPRMAMHIAPPTIRPKAAGSGMKMTFLVAAFATGLIVVLTSVL
ncbi:MAG: serine/threonine protein kinase [Myxococcota bacterium]|jgi:serine/threonine protein kinase